MLRLRVSLFFTLLVIVSGVKTLAAEPSVGKWTFGTQNHTCIIVQFAAKINVTYETTANQTKYIVLDIPSTNKTSVHGVCNSTNQSISISWISSGQFNNNFILSFSSEEKSRMYSLDEIQINLGSNDLNQFVGNGSVTFVHKHKEYPTQKDNSYRCIQIQTLDLQRNNQSAGYIKMSDLQYQAFISHNTTSFGLARDCPFDTPDYVPITVGCVLAGLVVVVLGAYLIGRRYNQAQGYLSM